MDREILTLQNSSPLTCEIDISTGKWECNKYTSRLSKMVDCLFWNNLDIVRLGGEITNNIEDVFSDSILWYQCIILSKWLDTNMIFTGFESLCIERQS